MRNVQLTNAEVFFLARNSVTESDYYRGSSKIKILFRIVLILLKIEIEGTLRMNSFMSLVRASLHNVILGF